MNGLAFEYNYGFEQYNTPLHLELSGNATNYTVSNVLFSKNENFGLSVGGMDGTITIENIYLNNRESANNVIDKNTNYRLPLVDGDRLDLASNPNAPGLSLSVALPRSRARNSHRRKSSRCHERSNYAF